MKEESYFNAIVEKQDELNIKTNGDMWRYGVTNNGREINWDRCIYMEACELIESFNWKHWKDIGADSNIENAKMELVDLWHFVASKILEENKLNDVREIYLKELVSVKDGLPYTDEIDRTNKIIEISESIIRLSLSLSNIIVSDLYITKLIKLQSLLGMSMKDVHDLYMIKNFLNGFRQENGYKEGTYIKEFDFTLSNGVNKRCEDNEIILDYTNREGSVEAGIAKFIEYYEKHK